MVKETLITSQERNEERSNIDQIQFQKDYQKIIRRTIIKHIHPIIDFQFGNYSEI